MRIAIVAVLVTAGAAFGQPGGPAPPKTTLIEPKTRLWQAIPSPDGTEVVTVTEDDRTLRIWNLATGKARTWEKGAADAGTVVFARDGKSVLVGRRDGAVSHHDLATGRELTRVTVGEKGGAGAAFFPLAARSYGEPAFDLSPDGKLLAMGNPNAMTVTLLKWPAGEVAARLQNEPKDGESAASPVQFGPGGKSLYCLCDGDARGFVGVWDVATGKSARVLVPPRAVSLMSVSPDGRWVAAGGGFNRAVTVWDTEANFRAIDLSIPGNNCQGIAFSPDGTRAVAVATFGMGRKGATAVLWDMKTRRQIRSWTVSDDYWHGGIVFFSREGQTVFIGGQRDGLHAWDVPAPKK